MIHIYMAYIEKDNQDTKTDPVLDERDKTAKEDLMNSDTTCVTLCLQ